MGPPVCHFTNTPVAPFKQHKPVAATLTPALTLHISKVSKKKKTTKKVVTYPKIQSSAVS